MWILWLFALFIEDTVYVTSQFPYGQEVSLTYPSSSFYFSMPYDEVIYPVFSSSFLLKKYGNLTSISFRGTRTQDISFELSGIPLKAAQSDYVDLSLFPASLFKNTVVITHPLSSYDPSMGSAGGVFTSLDTVPKMKFKFTSDKSAEFLIEHDKKVRIVGDFSFNTDPEKRYRRAFGMAEYREAALMLAVRDAVTSGPAGSGITGRKRDSFLGYRIGTFRHDKVGFSIKGNISTLVYRQGNMEDRHTGFSATSVLKVKPLIFSYINEAVFSTKAGIRTRNIPSVSLYEFTELMGLNLSLNTGLSFDGNTDRIYSSYFCGIAKNTGVLTVFFNFSKGIHLPSFFDLYWGGDVFSEGNPDLKGETVYQKEAGIKGFVKNSRVQITLFKKDIENMIQWIEVRGKYRPFNIGERSIRGVEFRLEHTTGKIRAGYSATLNGFSDILYMPHIEQGFWLSAGVFSMYFSYTGERQKKPSSPKNLPPFELVGISIHSVSRIRGYRYSLVAGIENLLGEKIEWLPGYVENTRRFYAGLEIKQ